MKRREISHGDTSSTSDESTIGPVGRGRGRRKQCITESQRASSEFFGRRELIPEKHKRITQLMVRPGYGELGQPLSLRANFKQFSVRSSIQVYQYDVKIIKYGGREENNRDLCRELFWAVVSDNDEKFVEGYALVYDDRHTLYSLNRLQAQHPEFELQLWVKEKPNFKPTHPSYIVRILYVKSFMASFDEQSENFGETMHLLDCLFTQRVRCPHMRVASKFHPSEQFMYLKPYEGIPWRVISMGPGLEAWNGLYGAVKRCEKELMLNVDVCTKVFYKIDMSIIDFYVEVLNEFVGQRRSIMFSDIISREGKNFTIPEHERERLKCALEGLVLKLTYADRHVRFLDIGKPARIQRFELRRGEENLGVVTVEEYFHRFKDIKLQFPNLPVFICGRTNKTEYFPMELLRISDRAQRLKKRLTPFQIAKLIRGTELCPLERFKRIDWFLNGMNIASDDKFLQHFGVTFPSVSDNNVPESVGIFGRVLRPPAIRLKAREMQVRDGFWRLEDNFYEAPNNVIPCAVCVDDAVNPVSIREPLKTLIFACEHLGIKFVPGFGPHNIKIYGWDTRNEDVTSCVIDFKKDCSKMAIEGLRPLMIFIVPQKHDGLYGKIKVACDKEVGIACQVILAEVFFKMVGNPSRNTVAHNICMKINTKLGGINNEVADNERYWEKFTGKEGPTLFLGIDVTHPSPGDKIGLSIASVVGSLNLNATRYGASIKIQQPRKEMIAYVVDAFRTRILDFTTNVGCKPEHIVLLRDGVSDSEFLDVMNEECLCLKTAVYHLDPIYDPTISYVVIQKRHHTRFISEDFKMQRGKGNIPPGTVVDRTITSSSRFDFYLCSHFGNIGTSKPAHYTVLFDSWQLTADEWQQMIYALCHVYARCNKSVSIPAPVYYAHLACERAKYLMKFGRESTSEAATSREPISVTEKSFEIHPNSPSMYFV